MFPSHRSEGQAAKTHITKDVSDINDADVDVDIDVDEEVDVDVSEVVDIEEVTKKKPHFLDYDAVPSPEFEERFDRALSLGIAVPSKIPHENSGSDPKLGLRHSGEQLKVDKKFERDGEISDYELAASGYTKKEFTQDDNTLHIRQSIIDRKKENKESFAKPKHFLDENPIPPDYMLEHELREHRSLDRNFERHHEQRSNSSPSLERKSSQDRMSRSSRDRYTLSRFIDNDVEDGVSSSALRNPIPKGGAWAETYDSRFNIPLAPHGASLLGEVDTLGPKVECVYSLLSMLGSNNTLEMSKKFLELSRTPETCTTLRRSGCIPLLVQMIHPDSEENVRKNANMALHNVVHSHPDEKAGRREAKVLRLLDQLIDYCNFLKTLLQSGGEAIADDSDRHPLAAISSLMKVSFDEEHRHAMCELGALQAIPSLVHLDHAVHGPKPEEQCCNSLRRYALMALTNLTFGDENNKALLCSQKLFMEALVVQLDSAPDDLLQVTASVLRNLSWRADSNMKAVLNEIGTVTALARAAMKNKSENTLKAILSALWNLSAHCSTNKAEFCAVDGALAFLVDMLTYEGPSKTLKIIENAGGILRNVSSHIAVCEHYRQILRERNCLSILLQQLKSESLTVVSNSCGTLWNLSARCPIDQKFLWDNGAVPMLRSLIHSKHAMISEGSSSALKNLLNFRPSVQNQTQMDHIARSMGLKKLPTLNARKKKALEQELGEKEHSETCDNLDIGPGVSKETSNFESTSNLQRICAPLGRNVSINIAHSVPPPPTENLSRSEVLSKSESRDSVFSAKSDSVYENIARSHSGTDDNRKAQAKKNMFAVHSQQTAFALKPEVEPTEEHPINYSIQYNENLNKNVVNNTNYEIREEDKNVSNGEGEENVSPDYATYQETDIDQPTDFSLRYAENQVESDIDLSSADADIALRNSTGIKPAPSHVKQVNNGNEILLILEDTVKCYQTEDTPYVISNAASVTDLHQNKSYSVVSDNVKSSMVPTKKYQKFTQPTSVGNFGSGSYTPEKPINYCEEGTPGYFSRYESLSSLDESPPQGVKSPSESSTHADLQTYKKVADVAAAPVIEQNTDSNAPPCVSENILCLVPKSSENCITPNSININSAQETPLMFSRHSSMDSLAEEDVGPCDDKSSVVSDFSRMASGVISPSDIPDSPTQSMPQSPRRNSSLGQSNNGTGAFVVSSRSTPRGNIDLKQGRLRSVFEDDFNTFHVENTPAQFSCATSLSNLSILDDENCVNPEIPQPTKTIESDHTVSTVENAPFEPSTISEGEEDAIVNNDDLLLASCINIGMSRSASISCKTNEHKVKDLPPAITAAEIPTHYCTEDTPALLSKVGSNTNLSSISINSNPDNKNEIIYGMNGAICPDIETISNRHSLNLSDDVSSNASDAGGSGQSFNILQQCILDGMKKAPSTVASTSTGAKDTGRTDPIAMMRRGGSVLPTYLHVSDEISNYKVEDTPCNFSIVSGLSNLTVGSSLVEPSIQIKGKITSNNNLTEPCMPSENMDKEDVRREHYRQDDSLSSLSIDSEDDTNLLCQAIAAGCNRPKSNLGFSSSSINNKRSTSLSASQPISMNSAPSTSSLTNACSASREHHRKSHSKQNNNDSYSSVESSDSNDNQSKSLFELCIRTGMNKNTSTNNNRKEKPLNANELTSKVAYPTSSSNPDIKNFELHTGSLQHSQKHTKLHQSHTHNRLKCEREKNDEELLMECINTGISKKISGSNENSSKHSVLLPTSTVPKNVKATSAAALEPHPRMEVTTSPDANSTAAPDVEKNTVTHMNESKLNHNTGDITDAQRNLPMEIKQKSQVISTKTQSPEIDPEKMSDIGYNMSIESVNIDITESDSNESFVMETTLSLEGNRNTMSYTGNKHKDPDLMLKSVERLTQEFVSSAEQLRTNGTSDLNDHGKRTAKNSIADTVSSHSNNTWNEDTCPNDISFPSVSITAPIAGLPHYNDYDDEEDDEATEADHKEFHDFAEITPTNEELPEPPMELNSANHLNEDYPLCQPNSIGTETETETDTLVNVEMNTTKKEVVSNTDSVNSGINFLVGGEVQNASATQPLQFSSCAMNNSTIIAMEARNLAENFLNNYDENTELTYSMNSLELENIRPPSEMDSLNMSGYYQDSLGGSNVGSQMNSFNRTNKPLSPHLSTKSPKLPRKALPTGLVARRAIGQLPGVLSGSVESVNSSCNFLDNIKPPSLMDELLDSMISVASIQSEIADCESLATTASVSNYETAAGGNDFDDNTITLQSCNAIPHEDDDEASINSGTLLPSEYEYSSAESTPRKSSGLSPGVKRTLTPKQKRKLAKDRFKTYTIAADIVLDKIQKNSEDAFAQDGEDETIQIEIDETYIVQGAVELKTNNQVISNNTRYKTQTIVCPLDQILPKPDVTKELTINKDLPSSCDEIENKKCTALSGYDNDYNSLENDQNSETESCHGHDNEYTDIELKDNNVKSAAIIAKPRIVKPGDTNNEIPNCCENANEIERSKAIRGRKKPAYVSPYKMQVQKKSISNATSSTFRYKNTNSAGSTSSTKPNNQSGNATPSIERQGTFVKEEPSIKNVEVPVVNVNVDQSGSPSRISKLPMKKQIPSPKSTVKSSNIRKMPATQTGGIIKLNAVRKTVTPQRSNSNATMRVTSSAARIAVLSSRISTTTPPSRSNSNLNCASSTTTGATTTTPIAVKINQAQSRIAGIWKRVDDVKTKQQKTVSTASNSDLKNGSKSSSQTINKPKLLRSSTFDTTPEQLPKAQKGQSNVHIERKQIPKVTQSKIAVNKTSFSVARKENIASRK